MSDVEVYVLEAFPFSRNGIKVEEAEAATTIDLPERLFDGLNAAGMVRRSIIGDGHITLSVTAGPLVLPADFAPVIVVDGAVVAAEPETNPVAASVAQSPVIEINNGPPNVVTPAPQPASATADLTEEELSALSDGTWKDWRFFKQRSVAAKLSDEAVKTGDQAKAIIEAYIAPKDDQL